MKEQSITRNYGIITEYPLTSYQRDIWIQQSLYPTRPFYNIGFYSEIKGKIDYATFSKAVNTVIKENDAMRIIIVERDGEPYQKFLPELKYKVEYYDFSAEENAVEFCINWMQRELIRPFNINGNILFEFKLLKAAEHLYYWFYKCHHMITDGWGFSLIIKRVVGEYNCLINGEGGGEENKKIYSYKDFIEDDKEYLKSDSYIKSLKFWEEKLKDLQEPLITRKNKSDDSQIITSSRKTITLKRDFYDSLAGFAESRGCSIFHFFLGALAIYFGRVYGKDEVVIGVPILNRKNAKAKATIGLFVNEIPLRIKLDNSLSFTDLLINIRDELKECYRHQRLPLGEILKAANIRDKKIFEITLSYQNQDYDSQFMVGPTEVITLTHQSEIQALAVGVREFTRDKDVRVEFDYQLEIFDEIFSIESVTGHFKNILEQVLQYGEKNIYKIEILTEDEKQKLLYDFNNTKAEYPKDKIIQQLFEEQVEKTPDNIAVVFEDKQLTYSQLNERANRLARLLRKKGVKPDSIVGLLVERSLEMIIGIFGILKAGGAYLPIDPSYPQDRIEYMLQDSGTQVLLIDNTQIDNETPVTVINLKDESIFQLESSSCGETSNCEKVNSSNDLAYIIYTSGTTGKPKGVMIEHRNVVRLLFNSKMQFDFNDKDVWTMFHSVCFDFSVWEIYGALLYGGKLIVVPKLTARDTREFLKLLKREKATVLNQTPTAFHNLINEEIQFRSELGIRYVIFGGEALKPIILKDWKNKYPHTKLINMYGITETTVHVTYKEITDYEIEHNISNIGVPIPTLITYIMDKNLKLAPIGVAGELCVGGDGVGRGYLGRPELTLEKFVINPYKQDERLYRSGDLARMLPTGEMEYLGRIDHQVKIRGFRIELGEIETRLLEHDSVKEAVVIARDDENGNKYLCAYVVVQNDYIVVQNETNTAELKERLSKNLPDYMIPSYFVKLDKLPLTSNGKVDKKALPQPNVELNIGEKYVAPQNQTEQKLKEIWEQVLKIDGIGVNNDFFNIGGHSLNAVVLISKINKEFGVELSIRDIFEHRSIKNLAEVIHITESKEYSEIVPVEEKECYEVSSAQKRMYILNKIEEGLTNYNIPGVLIIEGDLDRGGLEDSFKALVKRHEALRTSFEMIDDKPVQRIHREVEFSISYTEGMEEDLDNMIEEFVKPFDLKHAPLLRLGLVKLGKLGEARYALLIDMHHIISDGVSVEVIINELAKLYRGENLEPIKVQYKDFAAWQNSLIENGAVKKQEEYWIDTFSDEIPVLNMPLDYPRPPVQSFEGDRISFRLDEVLTKELNKLAEDNGATLYMTLLAVYNTLLYKYTGQEDIVVGSPIAGRRHADLHGIVGMFVNTLAMRNKLEGNMTFISFLQSVKENSIKAFENQDYQFEELLEKLDISRNLDRSPLFDTMFVLQNVTIGEIELEGCTILPYDIKNLTSKFDITLQAAEAHGRLEFSLEYCTALFKKDTIERMATHLTNIMRSIVENPYIKLYEIEILTEDEKQKLLYDFNNTKAEYPKDRTIHQLFEEQVEKTPNNMAVAFGDEKLTYKQLNERANQLARILREKGVKSDSIVGIMVERSLHMIVGIMGILKAGGAYLPIDPSYPQDRIDFMLQDSGAGVLLIDNTYEGYIQTIDISDKSTYTGDASNIEKINNLADASSLAYIIYTSGTTGKPKGVMIEHRNVVRLLFNSKMQFDFKDTDIWTMFHSVCFDFSVWEMYGALLYGGKLIIVPKLTARDTREYLKLLKKEKVTVLNQTPTAFYNLINEELQFEEKELCIRYVIFGGEALKPIMLKNWKEKYQNTKLINMYGITETTVHVTFKEITDYEIEHNISNIGKPIPTLTTYIMDKNLKLMPIGVAGELCVGGEGVGRGYLGRPELTAQKFIENPYIHGERLYRSGDLARMLPMGEMEYLGRIDHQVKIRGFRIELGEIESRLLELDSVKETVVLDRDDNGNKYLCAYIVTYNELTTAKLREHLSKQLPDYMIPQYFVQRDKIPLTSNGKVDRKALPNPVETIGTGVEYVAARNEMEQKLVGIWSEILGIEKQKLSIRDSFFTIGGDSIKSIRLAGAINKHLDTDMKVAELYRYTTIESLAVHLSSNACRAGDEIARMEHEIELMKSSILDDAGLASKLPPDFEDIYPMSDIELGMVYHSLKESEKAIYHDQMLFPFKDSQFEYSVFKKAMSLMVLKHSILRTSFNIKDFAFPMHVVHKNIELDIKEIDIKDMGKKLKEQYIKDYLREDRSRPFDISNALMWRMRIFDLGGKDRCIGLLCHHAILDGWSVASLMTELLNTYLTLKREDYVPKMLKNDYKRVILEQMAIKNNNKVIEYWKQELRDYKRLSLPKNNIGSEKLNKITWQLGSQMHKRLMEVAQKYDADIKAICVAAYVFALYMISYENDITSGVVETIRPVCEDGDKILGCCLNSVPVRLCIEKDMTWGDLIRTSTRKLTDLKQFGQLSLFEISKATGENFNQDNPVFDVIFNYIDFHVLNQLENKDSIQSVIDLEDYERINMPLMLQVSNTLNEFKLELKYLESTLQKEQATSLGNYFINVLNAFIADANEVASKEKIFTPLEIEQILYGFNNTNAEYPKDKTIQQLFEEQVEKTPDNIAVVFEDKQLPYSQLNERANSLARILQEKGVKPDTIVGIMVERSLEMMVGIIGILKAGGAYLPIDPEYPKERINFMLQDSGTRVVLINKGHTTDNCLTIDNSIETIDISDISNIEKINNLNDLATASNLSNASSLAYVIYTSGSTGKPKGVMIEHRNVSNFIEGMVNKIDFTPNKTILALTTISFDIFVLETLLPLTKGLKIVIANEGQQEDPKLLSNLIVESGIDMIQLTPSRMRMLLSDSTACECLRGLKEIMIGGEAFPTALLEDLRKLTCAKIYNMYGPTETTVWSTMQEVTCAETIDIGKPISNTQIYIIGINNNLQSIGTVGELCIAGAGLARGYLNRPELTTERFIPNPFKLGEMMYRTGDLARWLPNGNIEYLGRIDHQVKIRGYRIELGEIESRLLEHDSVTESVVIAKDDKISAYIVAHNELTIAGLREHLSKELPDYMIPSYFIQIDKIPLTPNGKVDRKALPQPELEFNTGEEYVAPQNQTEQKLKEVWEKVLKVEGVGINNDFFNIGGHSLNAGILISKVNKEFGVELSIKDIFMHRTVRELAGIIAEAEKIGYMEINPVKEKEYYGVSSAQKRMYILDKMEGGLTNYNISGALIVEGGLDRLKLEDAFKVLVKRHESLRTSFEMIDDKLIQRIHSEVEFGISYTESMEKDLDEILKEFVKPFDLGKAPLLRLGLVKFSETRHALLVDMHHIISDGVSIGVIINELTKLYRGENLEPIKVQYKDFAAWQNSLIENGAMRKQEEYWIDTFSDEIPVLSMPLDYLRPPVQSFEGDRISFKLDEALTKKLNKLAGDNGVTLYMTLLSVYNVLLSKYTGQEDIVVGSPIAGRRHADLHGIVGMFVNTLAMRNRPEGNMTFISFLQSVKENSIESFENQDYQFEELIERLDIKRDLGRNPLFDSMFILQNTNIGEIELGDCRILPYDIQSLTSKFDITLQAVEADGRLEFSLEYCTALFKRETIERMAVYFTNALRNIVENPYVKLREIEILDEDERRKLLYDFNNTRTEYPKDKTLHQLFEEQVEKTPDNVAVVFGDKQLTYRQLNERANQLARILREKGVEANAVVGMVVERSIDMIIGILGILKAGGAYMPMDPDFPQERMKYMMEDSNAGILLTQKHLADRISFDCEVLYLEDQSMYHEDSTNLYTINNSDDLAYLIYTSGSTGKPKGSLTTHYNISRVVKNTNYIDITQSDIILQLSNYAFDGSTFDIYGALLNGAKLVLVSKEIVQDVGKLSNLIIDEKISVFFITTALFNTLVDLHIECFTNIRKVLFGGERVSVGHTRKALEYMGKDRIIHVYGPTETTVYATYYFVNEIEEKPVTIPIGSPLANTKAYILDKNMKLQPIGFDGELCIAGDGLAKGYLNRPELTREKFVENPFEPDEKMYRTGDLARWLPDGNIEFLGRIDQQVKIRGFRIELGEIESKLLEHSSTKEAVVIDRDDENGNKYLCAYIVVRNETNTTELKEHLSKNLPNYMIPSYFVQLDKIPLTSNGKVDKKALPQPKVELNIGEEYVAPQTPVEQKLKEIWEQVLKIEGIGVNNDFFNIGGHSLNAVVLISRINKEFGVELSIRNIFEQRTIRNLERFIHSTESKEYIEITPVEEKEYYEVSSAQKRMYILSKIEEGLTNYNMPGVLIIEGNFDRAGLEHSFKALVKRHEALRTSFEMIDDKPVQRIHREVEFGIRYTESMEKDLDEIVKEFVKPFDLKHAPLLRLGLVKFSETRHALLIDMHHIISDGVSMGVIINELTKLYRGENLEPIRVQYKDFAAWQNSLIENGAMKKQEEYWLDTFSDEIPVLNMPLDYPRPPIQSFKGNRISLKIDEELTKELNALAEDSGATLYMTLFAAYNVMLSRYTGQEDIVIGSPIAGRKHADLHGMVGMFVNTLAMRNRPKGNMTFASFLQSVKENAIKAFENQDYQFEELIEKLAIKRDLGRNPLFDTMFALQNVDIGEIELQDCCILPYDIQNFVAKFDITLQAVEADGRLEFSLEYATSLFKQDTIDRMATHYINILRSIVKNPHVKLSEIEMIADEERRRILYDFNNTKIEYPKDKTLHQLFEEQVEKTPDSVAVVFGDKQLTYRQLNERANQLARILREKGVEANSVVGMVVERSIDMIIGILGILKAGGAYMPMDPDFPQERMRYMMEDSNASILLTQRHLADRIGFDCEVVLYLEDQSTYHDDNTNLYAINNSDDLAYLIYTSGSTGKPKGSLTTHYNISRVVMNTNYIEITQSDIILQLSNYAFDGSTFDIYGALLNGAKLVLISKGIVQDVDKLSKLIIDEKISVFFITTALFNTLVDLHIECFANIRKVLFGGERVSVSHTRKALEYMGKGRIIHVYGPTESTVYATYYFVNEIEENPVTIPIGSPLANTKAYILDKNMNLQPIGVAGELCITGDGLAKGYLNRPELTNEKFVENPLEPCERMYRTGDLARWHSNGNIEFLGRIDQQVKIRGFRIELGEIESRLLEHDSVKEAVVIDRDDENGNKTLSAYIVAHDDVTVAGLREHLSKELPDYMIPAYFVRLEKIPLTPNGKVDRKALPEIQGSDSEEEYVEPQNTTEQKLKEIWEQVLKTEGIGVNTDFFNRGGHSLNAVVLIARINKEFGVELSIRDIFEKRTIRNIAGVIAHAENKGYSGIVPVEEKEYYELSSAQKRMYILNKMEEGLTNYNMPAVLIIEGDLDRVGLEDSFKALVKRHEALRTSFEIIDDKPVQRIHREVEFGISYTEGMEKDLDNMIKEFVKPFDLKHAPLLRLGLVKLGEARYALLIDMHHIISDGVSMGVIINELTKLYRGENLEPIKVQYKDFAAWQNSLIENGAMKKQEEYWIDTFSGEIPVLNMPLDYSRPPIQRFEGDRISFKIDEELTKELNTLAKGSEATLYMILLAAYNVMLSKYTGQDDIVVGSPIAGRRHADLQCMVGMFVNTLAMRNRPEGNMTFASFLQSVKENAIKAFENQDYQFEELIERLDIRRDLGRNPLFDTIFELQNIDIGEIELQGCRVLPYDVQNHTAKFDISLNAIKVGDKLEFSLEYCTSLFKKDTIGRIARHYINILKSISQNLHVKLSEIEMLDEEEKRTVLYDFNNTMAEYPKDKTIHQLFEEQVKKTPDNVAVVFEDKQLTYRQLNERANSLAHNLREKGIKPNTIVGIMVERSLETVIGILGILKAGGAYLPIDPDYPQERIKFMLEDTGAQVLLTNNEIYMDATANLDILNKPTDLAYIIYTSGSTGKPKGAMIEHKNIVNQIVGLIKSYKFDSSFNYLLTAKFTFDMSLENIFLPIISGARLFIVQNDLLDNPAKLLKYIKDNSINFLDTVPAFMDTLVQYATEKLYFKCIFIGADVFSTKLYENIKATFHVERVFNTYGPTETTINASIYECKDVENGITIPIGKPVTNYSLYVLDKNLLPVPVGISGELYISGDGVGRGYLNLPDLTKEKFIPNPFIPNERMYRTGDLVKWLPDGNIEFMGRIDYQVKIRGLRIELGEIESKLLEHDSVKEAVVIDRDDGNGSKTLNAYIVANDELTTADLRQHLSKELPSYMIPSYFIQLDKIPLTSNGKVDRRALPEPSGNINTGSEYVAPSNVIEERLVEVWKELLGIESIGVHNNFFELGGHSLKTISLVAKIQREFGVELSFKDIFSNPTIRGIAQCIASSDIAHPDRSIMLLNEQKEKNIFAFPPMGSYGIAYKELAKNLEEYSFYTFNFIEEDDRLDVYVKLITDVQKSGPYVLFGYSAGGNLAFEVAKQLTALGHEVSNVILLDAVVQLQEVEESEECVKEQVLAILKIAEGIRGFAEVLNDSNMKDKMARKIECYIRYFNQLVTSGVIHSDITLIQAESENQNEYEEMRAGWVNHTVKKLIRYNGAGRHPEMLQPSYMGKNAEIIRKVLSSGVCEV